MAEPLSKSLMHWAEVAEGCGNEERADLMRWFADRAFALEARLATLEAAEAKRAPGAVLQGRCECGTVTFLATDGWVAFCPRVDVTWRNCPNCGSRLHDDGTATPWPKEAPVLHDYCTCGLLEWHEHDAGDADWFGPSGWFRKWPTDPAPDFCCVCGTKVGPGNMAYPSPLYEPNVKEAPSE